MRFQARVTMYEVFYKDDMSHMVSEENDYA